MARWQPEKRDVLEALAAEILHNYGSGRVIVAVDGNSGADTAGFADDLATVLRDGGRRVFRAALSDFHRSRAARAEYGDGTPRTYYDHAFDYSLLQRVLIDPFRAAGSTGFVLAGFDGVRDQPIQPKWMTAGADAMLLVDGVFLNRAELAGIWNFSVWLETAESDERDVAAEADAVYLSEAGPAARASAIIDDRDVEHPRRVFADSC